MKDSFVKVNKYALLFNSMSMILGIVLCGVLACVGVIKSFLNYIFFSGSNQTFPANLTAPAMYNRRRTKMNTEALQMQAMSTTILTT